MRGIEFLIVYDAPPSTEFEKLGFGYAIMLKNLIAHFDTDAELMPFHEYVAGKMNDYDAAFYLGACYDNPIPSALLADMAVRENGRLVQVQLVEDRLGCAVWVRGEVRLQPGAAARPECGADVPKPRARFLRHGDLQGDALRQVLRLRRRPERGQRRSRHRRGQHRRSRKGECPGQHHKPHDRGERALRPAFGQVLVRGRSALQLHRFPESGTSGRRGHDPHRAERRVYQGTLIGAIPARPGQLAFALDRWRQRSSAA